jgi:cytochrome oxidase assembly protein ShyY1
MYRFLLKPKWLALHVVLIALVGTMCSLANWQWNRHIDRKAFNETLIQRFTEPPQPLLELLQQYPMREDAQWRLATISGTYLEQSSINVVNVSQDGRAGYDPVSPLQLDDGRIVLVNRGFVPLDAPQPPTPSGEVEVTGRVRVSAERRTGAVSDPATGVLKEAQRIDIERLAQQLPSPVIDVYLEAIQSKPSDSEMLSIIAPPIFGNGSHLGYVGQWLLFSLCAIGGWIALVLREKRVLQKPAGQQATN